ncbi:MAG: beta-lactamase family protein [Verrucomicrobia bacterium]|nr:beta-lactamase family protein [Verrucomicrobiota bacterium]
MKSHAFCLCPVATLILQLTLAIGAQAASPPPDLDALVGRARREFDVPGIAIAIVKEGEPSVVKGYGVRRMNEPHPVDGETQFNIASNSKAFTVAALGLLADEGKLGWDDPVTKHLPGFQMYDAWVTREITVRDLLAHRSGLGLGAGDLLTYPLTTFTTEEIIFRQRFIKPATGFRSGYAYDNCLYVVAGQVVEAVSGKTWNEFVRRQLFAPLDMKHSSIGRDALTNVVNKAISHVASDGRLLTVDYMNTLNDAAAGGINSCAADMAKWTAALLADAENRGTNGRVKRILSGEMLSQMWSAQTPIPVRDPGLGPAAAKAKFAAYGLGFFLRDYRGLKVVWHSGGMPGQVSRVALVPELKLGVVLLSNKEPNKGLEALTYHILDHYLNAPVTDWIGAFRRAAEEEQAKADATVEALGEKRAKDSNPSLPLVNYAGAYVDSWYGEVTLTLENERLVLRFSRTPALVGDLEHWQHDSFVVRWRDRRLNADAFVYFALNPDGAIDAMKMKAVSPLTDFSFDFHDLDFKPSARRDKQ